MKKHTIASMFFVVLVVAASGIASAQSGTTGGFGGGGGGGAIGGGGGGVGGISGGSSNGFGGFGGTRLSSAERAEIRRQQAIQRQQQAIEIQKRQAELAKINFKNTLVQLGLRTSATPNRRQNKLAFEEAKRDFKALRRHEVAPSQIGAISQPFRLDQNALDRMKNMANWPKLFKSQNFKQYASQIDLQITGGLDDTESAKEFLNTLMKLNSVLNSAAFNGKVASVDYARARRFVTGLANEVRATSLVM